MSPTPRQRRHDATAEDIKDAAWHWIAEHGAPALSLRGVAADLGMTAPALYRYFPSRDELVTALIVDAYTSFGDSQLAARDAVPGEDLIGRLEAIGLAYRDWALAHPQRYQLIFGTPLPGYQAPVEQIMPAGARSLSALTSVIEALRIAGKLRAEGFPKIKVEFKAEFEIWKTHGGNVDVLSLSVAMLIWARVHGIVSLEIAGNLPPFGPDGDALYRYELASLQAQFIKE